MLENKMFEPLVKAFGKDMAIYLYGVAIGAVALKVGQITHKFVQKQVNRKKELEFQNWTLDLATKMSFEVGIIEGKRLARLEDAHADYTAEECAE